MRHGELDRGVVGARSDGADADREADLAGNPLQRAMDPTEADLAGRWSTRGGAVIEFAEDGSFTMEIRTAGFVMAAVLLLNVLLLGRPGFPLLLRAIVAVVNDDVITATELVDGIGLAQQQIAASGSQSPPRDVLERQVLERIFGISRSRARAYELTTPGSESGADIMLVDRDNAAFDDAAKASLSLLIVQLDPTSLAASRRSDAWHGYWIDRLWL